MFMKGYLFHNEKKFDDVDTPQEKVYSEKVFESILNMDLKDVLYVSVIVDQINNFDLAIRVFQNLLEKNKPVVLLNRNVVSEANPVTHSGRMIKDMQIFNSLMDKYGVINCYSYQELKYASMILSHESFQQNASNVEIVNVGSDIRNVIQKELEVQTESDIKITSIENKGNCIQYGKVTYIVDETLSHAIEDSSESCFGQSLIVPNSRVFFKMLNKCINRFTKEYDFNNMALTTNKVFGSSVTLSEIDSRAMLAESDVRLSKNHFTKTLDDLLDTADRVGYPVVMKVNSLDIPHKSDVGGVVLHIPGREELRVSYHKMMSDVSGHCPDAVLDGVLLTEEVPKGYEIILGAYNHNVYGPIVMVGDGGTTTEVFKDVAYAPVPVNKADATEMVEKLRILPILSGYRGTKKLDINQLVKDIQSLSDYMYKNIDTVKEIDINPLFLYEEGLGSCAVDALVVIKKED